MKLKSDWQEVKSGQHKRFWCEKYLQDKFAVGPVAATAHRDRDRRSVRSPPPLVRDWAQDTDKRDKEAAPIHHMKIGAVERATRMARDQVHSAGIGEGGDE